MKKEYKIKEIKSYNTAKVICIILGVYAFLMAIVSFIGMRNVNFYYGDSVVHEKETLYCDFACTPCVEEPPQYVIDISYVAVKDSLNFKKGDIFTLRESLSRYWTAFCNDSDENGICVGVDDILNSGFFKELNK